MHFKTAHYLYNRGSQINNSWLVSRDIELTTKEWNLKQLKQNNKENITVTIYVYSNKNYVLQIDKCSLVWINKIRKTSAHILQWVFPYTLWLGLEFLLQHKKTPNPKLLNGSLYPCPLPCSISFKRFFLLWYGSSPIIKMMLLLCSLPPHLSPSLRADSAKGRKKKRGLRENGDLQAEPWQNAFWHITETRLFETPQKKKNAFYSNHSL